MARFWNANYYDLLEFYLFEPQHIAPKLGSDGKRQRSVPESLRRLKRLETPFNHIFSLFFRLAPSSMIERLVHATMPPASVSPSMLSDLQSIGREAGTVFGLKSATQPDLLFVGSSAIVCVEMKVDAKTDAEQIFKYAALCAHIDPAGAKKRFLIYMAPKDFSALWPAKGATLETAKSSALALAAALPAKLSGNSVLRGAGDRVAIVEALELGFISYRDFRRLLEAAAADADSHDGVYRKLIDGLVDEISARGY